MNSKSDKTIQKTNKKSIKHPELMSTNTNYTMSYLLKSQI